MYRIRLFISAIMILSVFIAHPAFSSEIDSTMQGLFEKLSDGYVKQFPVKSTKRSLAVLQFNEESEAAKNEHLGSTLREILSGKVVTSQIFYLVDRDSLDASLKEMQLSMTGVVDEKSMTEAGKISGVKVFLTGSISELQGDIMVTAKLVEAETGKVVVQESATVKSSEMLDKKQEIEFAYIAKYGIGINFQYSMVSINCPLDNYAVDATDVFVNYRPYLWLSFKLGINMTNLKMDYRRLTYTKSMYPLMPDLDLPDNISYNEGNMNLIGPYVGFDFNWTPTEKFTLAVGLSVSTYDKPTLTQHYYPANLWSDKNSNTIIDQGERVGGGMFDVEQQYYDLSIFRFELKPQYFISPRLTIGLYFAYYYSPAMKVYKSVINNEYTGFPGEGSGGSSEIEDSMAKKYYGMPLTILGDNKDANDLTFNGGMAAGISVNFYF